MHHRGHRVKGEKHKTITSLVSYYLVFTLCSAERLSVLCGNTFSVLQKNSYAHLLIKMNVRI